MTHIKIEDGIFVDDEFVYVNKHYGSNLKKGQRVKTFVGEGMAIGATHHVYVDHGNEICCYHPQDIEKAKVAVDGNK